MTYDEIERLPPEAYLNPDNFKTPMDGAPPAAYAEEQYQKGLQTANEYDTVHIAANGVWTADREGAHVASYEGIGYHSGTAPLLRGFLDGRAELVVYRSERSGHPRRTVVKPRREG